MHISRTVKGQIPTEHQTEQNGTELQNGTEQEWNKLTRKDGPSSILTIMLMVGNSSLTSCCDIFLIPAAILYLQLDSSIIFGLLDSSHDTSEFSDYFHTDCGICKYPDEV